MPQSYRIYLKQQINGCNYFIFIHRLVPITLKVLLLYIQNRKGMKALCFSAADDTDDTDL